MLTNNVRLKLCAAGVMSPAQELAKYYVRKLGDLFDINNEEIEKVSAVSRQWDAIISLFRWFPPQPAEDIEVHDVPNPFYRFEVFGAEGSYSNTFSNSIGGAVSADEIHTPNSFGYPLFGV